MKAGDGSGMPGGRLQPQVTEGDFLLFGGGSGTPVFLPCAPS
jgi:hypothetical protein